ncbi:MAG: bifunctional UDP-sugar hydrolase/5'-nucleotidase [Coriobacteriia bacterium]|nr:bifunctional UDP-sugar hydrolase/5'-nucleotidase [Coriobacteriia bacterium]
MGITKKFTILHSNDMHGDFLAEEREGGGPLHGGLALLSAYVNKVRAEEENVFYVIAGDMLQGSIIDSDFKGISTIDIMNYITPDVVGVGNHEIDYGVPHLLFLEKIANFPIVSANLYIKGFDKRLMDPYVIIEKAGFDVLFTGIITEKVVDAMRLDDVIGAFMDVHEAADEVGRICNAYRNDDIDLTILLTHIGFESDVELAALLDPAWGVDMIIGGHSHTVLEQPAVVNGILVTQAGTGTDQIGRFDIVVDDDTNSIVEWTWQLIPISSDLVEPDQGMVDFIARYKSEVDRKYSIVVTKLTHEHTHPRREVETDLGNLMADALAAETQADVVLLGAGSVRVEKLGPVVTLMDFMGCFPYDDTVTRYTVTGATLKRMFAHWMRPENRDGEGECYQVNGAVRALYSDAEQRLISLEVAGATVDDAATYTVALQGYHAKNCVAYLDVTEEELLAAGSSKVVTTSAAEVLEVWLRDHQLEGRAVEGRLTYA